MPTFTSNDIDVTYAFNADSKTVTITDNVDYSVYSNINPSTLKGLGSLLNSQSDVVYSQLSPSNPLINLAASATEATKNLLTTTDGSIVNGVYTWLYRVYNTFSGSNIAIALFDNSNEITVLGLNLSVLTAGSQITVTGATNPANNQVFTVSSVRIVGPDSLIVVEETVVTGAGDNAKLAYSVSQTYEKTGSFTYTGCDKKTPVITLTSDCNQGQFGSITIEDDTNYGTHTLLSRTLQLYAPTGIEPSPPYNPWTATTKSLTVNQLATGTWTGKLIASVTYTQTDGLVVIYTFPYPSNVETTTVVCNGNMCVLLNCINKFWLNYNRCGTTPSPNMVLLATKITYSLNGYRESLLCGDADAAAEYYNSLKELLSENGCGCGCDGENTGDTDVNDPVWIDNSNSSAITTIQYLLNAVSTLQEEVAALQEQDCCVNPIAHVVDRLELVNDADNPFIDMFIDKKYISDLNGYFKFTTIGAGSLNDEILVQDSTSAVNESIALPATTSYFTLSVFIGKAVETGNFMIRWYLVYVDGLGATFTSTDSSVITFPANTDMTLSIKAGNTPPDISLTQSEAFCILNPSNQSS